MEQHETALPIVDGYEVLGQIGSGGSATVYRAWQKAVNRDVAIKVFKRGRISPQRLSIEARNLGLVSGLDDIVEVYAVAETADGLPCLIMEYFPQGSLKAHLGQGALSVDVSLRLGIALARSLQLVHEQNLIHDDIKPPNVFIRGDSEPVLGDFGIAAQMGERWAGAGLTLHWAAPERVSGQPPTVASDVYSLAATVYNTVSARRPFDLPDGRRQTRVELEHRILSSRPPRLDPDVVPDILQDVLFEGMARVPAERHASAAAFAEDLVRVERTLSGELLSPERKRRRFVSAVAAAALLLIGAIVAVVSSQDAPGTPVAENIPDAPNLIGSLPVPFNLAVERDPGSSTRVLLTWDIATPQSHYEVRRDDVGGIVPVSVTDTRAELNIGEGERPCYRVVSVDPEVRSSDPSQRVCLNE